MASVSAEKTIERISKIQKQKLVEYMATDLEFAIGQFSGVNSNSNYKDKWETLKTTLNSLGGSEKTIEQWKKCWIDLKCSVKKSINHRRKFMNQTGGGSWINVPKDLSSLEEKIPSIMAVDDVDGDSCTPESGFPLEESAEDILSVDFLEGEEIYSTPAKKLKSAPPRLMPSTSKAAQNKLKVPPSNYNEALGEAKIMQEELITKMNNLEKQNQIILAKLDKIEKILENNLGEFYKK